MEKWTPEMYWAVFWAVAMWSGGIALFCVCAYTRVIEPEYAEARELNYELGEAVAYLQEIGYSYAKANRKVNKQALRVGEKLAMKQQMGRPLTPQQQRLVDYFHDQCLETGQTFQTRVEVVLPPDDSGKWIWSDELGMWEAEGGRVRDVGRRASSSAPQKKVVQA